jgi:hypothetical protein
MFEPFVAHRRDRQSPDRIDELGMLYWKSGVLVIGLRVLIVLQLSAPLLARLGQVVTLLLWGALALVLADLLRLLGRALRSARLPRAAQPARPFPQLWRAWLGGDWATKLAIDCALAAAIILLALGLAAQERLNWPVVAWLIVIGMVRVVFHDRCARADASGGRTPRR